MKKRILISSALAILLIARQYFINYIGILTVFILALLLYGGISDLMEHRYIQLSICALALVSGIIRLLGGAYILNIIFVASAILWQITELFTASADRKQSVIIISAIIVLINVPTLLDAVSGDFYIRFMQSPLNFDVSNSFDAPVSQRLTLENGSTYISDISYESEYPNGYLDIYISPKNDTEACPTFIFVHGGGFTWGDKVDGDPNGGEGGGQQWYFGELLNAGYNVVSINYALSPDYRYPTPVLQLCEATEYLKLHAEEYGIDMTDTIYSGGSAGGSIVGQFICAQTNSGYSAKTGISQVIDAEHIQAVVFASALLDGARYYKTGSVGFDFMLSECGRVYFGEDFIKSDMIGYTDIIENADSGFPATYLSDGNYGSFTDQAEDLYQKLTELGVTAEFTYYDGSVEALGHGFEIFKTPCGEDNLVKTIAFLDENVKASLN